MMTKREIYECAVEVERWLIEEGDPLCGDDWSAMQVVRQYLTDHRADDHEPITREWLESIGFNEDPKDKHSLSYCDRTDRFWDFVDLLCYEDGSVRCWTLNQEIVADCLEPATRGELRYLCRKAKINLPETPATPGTPGS